MNHSYNAKPVKCLTVLNHYEMLKFTNGMGSDMALFTSCALVLHRALLFQRKEVC